MRWGPIWSGFFTIVATLVVLGALGAAIGLTVWGATTNSAFVYGWAIFTGVVAYFLGGWVTARSAGVAGSGAALLNAGLAWALSLIAILALVIIGAGNVVGFLGSNLYLLLHSSTIQTTPSNVAGTIAQTAWITFISLVIGLILAMIGGLVGSRSLQARQVRRTL